MIAAVTHPTPDPAWGIGLGVGLFAVAAVAAWGSVHLREKAHDRWESKVDVAFTALQTRATEIFGELRDAIDDVVPPAGAPFDPAPVVADPAPVGRLAKRAVRVLRERMRIRRQFRTFLVVCSIAKWLALIFGAAVIASTLLYFLAFSATWLWAAAVWVSAVIGAAGLAVVLLYSVIEGTLQRSYEHSRSTPSAVAE